MSKLSKSYFSALKGEKVTLVIVKEGGDIKVEFVDHFEDFKVKTMDSPYESTKVIKIEVVDHWGDVKLKKVDHWEDFEAYII